MSSSDREHLILRNLLLIQGAGFLKGMIHSFFTWFLPILVMNVYGPIMFSLVFTMRFIMFFVHFLGGYLADISRKWTLALSDTLLLIFLICLLIVYKYTFILLPLIFLWYFYYALPTAAAQLLRMESVPSNWRGKILSIAPTLATISHIAGSLLFGYLYATCGLSYVIKLMLIMVIICIISRIFLIETSPGRKSSRREYLREVFSVFRSRDYIWFALAAFLIGISLNCKVFIPPYMNKILKLNIVTIAIIYTIFDIVSAVGSIYLGHLLDKYRSNMLRIFSIYLLIDAFTILLAILLSLVNPLLITIIAISETVSSIYFAAVSLYINEKYVNIKGMALMSVRALIDLAAFMRPLTGFLWLINPQIAIISTTTIPLIIAAIILKTKMR